MSERFAINVEDLTIEARADAGWISLVKGISFQVQEKRVAGLIGESGSGKTLTAQVIAGLLPRHMRMRARRLEVLGHDVCDWDRQQEIARGRNIGFVFQHPMSMLTPVLTIGEQLTEGIRFHLKLGRRAVRNQAIAMLAQVGLKDNAEAVMRSYPHMLSGGMLQRIMIAMALLPGPRLLIADEPTTALDVTTQVRVLELLSNLTQEMELSVLFISHDMSVIANVCDDVMVMEQGHLIELGSVEHVFSHPQSDYTKRLLEATAWHMRQPI